MHESQKIGLSQGKKVAFVLNRFALGGAETQVRRVSSELAKRGWSVQAISIFSDVIEPEELDKVGVVRLSLDGSRGIRSFMVLSKLSKELKRFSPDVVVSLMIPADPIARLAAYIARIPLVSSLRNEYVGGWLVQTFLKATDRFVSVLTVNTDRTKRNLGRLVTTRPDDIVVVRNAIMTEKYKMNPNDRFRIRKELGIAENEFVWISVGAQRPQKNYNVLIRVLGNLANCKLIIAGAPYQYEELASLSSTLGISERVLQVGRRDDIPALLAASDAFVMSSLHEGLPNALMEAMVAGLPVVAPDVGGVSELIRSDKFGFLVQSSNQDGLVSAMKKLMQTSVDVRSKMGEAASCFIKENYEMEFVVDQWESILRGCIKT